MAPKRVRAVRQRYHIPHLKYGNEKPKYIIDLERGEGNPNAVLMHTTIPQQCARYLALVPDDERDAAAALILLHSPPSLTAKIQRRYAAIRSESLRTALPVVHALAVTPNGVSVPVYRA